MEDNLIFLKMEDDLKKNNASKTNKTKHNGCGTTPGNLVFSIVNPNQNYMSRNLSY
jgi:hypothetical protein